MNAQIKVFDKIFLHLRSTDEKKNWHFLKPNAKDALKSVVEVVGEGCPFLTMGLSRPQLKLAPERTTQMGMRVWDLRAKWCQKPWEWVADKGW